MGRRRGAPTHTAAIDQLAIFIGGQEQAAHVVRAVLGRAPPDHHELLPLRRLDLQPSVGAITS